MPLAVNVPADGDGGADGLDVGLEGESFAGFVAEVLDLGFCEGGAVGEFGEVLFEVSVAGLGLSGGLGGLLLGRCWGGRLAAAAAIGAD